MPLTDVRVDLVADPGPLSWTLDKDSTNFSGDTDNDDVLDVGETWLWTIPDVGPLTVATTFTATGYGKDPLGNPVTFPQYPYEQNWVPVPPVPELSTILLFSLGIVALGGFVLLRRRQGHSKTAA